MIKFRSLIIYIAILFTLIASYSIAQEKPITTHYTLYCGLSAPGGDFGNSFSDKAGFANTGFTAMFEVSKDMNEIYSWITSFAMATNSFDETTISKQLKVSKVDGYNSYWGMTGIRLEVPVFRSGTLYSSLLMGALIMIQRGISLSYGIENFTQTTDSTPAFAYGFESGVNMGKIRLSTRWLFSNINKLETQSEPLYAVYNSKSSKQPIEIIQMLVGYNF